MKSQRIGSSSTLEVSKGRKRSWAKQRKREEDYWKSLAGPLNVRYSVTNEEKNTTSNE